MEDKTLSCYWETVVDIIHDGVMMVDPGGIIVSVNRAFTEMTGYERDELLGCNCSILKCSSCERIYDSTNQHWCLLFRNSTVSMRKCHLTRKDGSLVHAMKNASVLRNEGGVTIGAVETWADVTELMEKESQIAAFRHDLQAEDTFYGMVGMSTIIRRTFDLLVNVAASDAPAFIFGESGTGKELAAKAIHLHSDRKNQPYIQVNCAALNESVLESELFGHVKGAFTGAYQNRQGRFEAAHGGDIFLDEIGELPHSIQVKLLRVLEEKVIERVGDNRPIPVDVRIITATNRNLRELVEKGVFRRDLYYRINVLPIELPPLRKRPEDIPLLAENFFRHLQLKSNKQILGISPEAMRAVVRYPWPGNIRELKSAFTYAFVTCTDGHIDPSHLPPDLLTQATAPSLATIADDEQKKQELLQALTQARGNKSMAAKILGVSRVTVWNRLHRYGLLLRD
ncbi:sigma 54-interacting transcriptional regulator [uncultured Desulfobulbus sp.]|uniref:sigma-54 interaction domain-containing protein n=1 Tax=uncultured Desulfobulbus sp. TaxID=239745 RepID=UPI0029C810D3|nr:sigma 54-interacting transcriptional regulator [uncultured Desulfobulbus sp.]